MASPHVAGVAALVLSASPEPLAPADVKAILKDSTRAFPEAVDKPIGVGVLDADAAVTLVIEGPPEPCDPEVEQCEPDAIALVNKVPLSGQSGAAGGVYYIKLVGERAYGNVIVRARHN
ncbi:S8 family serine peptidase [Lysobacter alkalisoli]|uniref:S8 family serine peptidase n=1 Tax=Marilutibacter alkalisoli TaxID=2591633 RepID=A0A514BUH6_9GAMM|nr:S8 family serine peptidase [Lysobacter alkalisoli]